MLCWSGIDETMLSEETLISLYLFLGILDLLPLALSWRWGFVLALVPSLFARRTWRSNLVAFDFTFGARHTGKWHDRCQLRRRLLDTACLDGGYSYWPLGMMVGVH